VKLPEAQLQKMPTFYGAQKLITYAYKLHPEPEGTSPFLFIVTKREQIIFVLFMQTGFLRLLCDYCSTPSNWLRAPRFDYG
jgi:hypothetical protein